MSLSLLLKKPLAAKTIEFAAACSNPSGWCSNFKFGRRIPLPKGMPHEKFRSNLSHTSWDMAICNKFWSKMLHFAATQWTEHAPPLPIWKRRSKYTTMPNFIFSAGNEAYICTPPNYENDFPPRRLKTRNSISSIWNHFTINTADFCSKSHVNNFVSHVNLWESHWNHHIFSFLQNSGAEKSGTFMGQLIVKAS